MTELISHIVQIVLLVIFAVSLLVWVGGFFFTKQGRAELKEWNEQYKKQKGRKRIPRGNKYWPDSWYENYLRTGNRNYLVNGKP